MAVSIKMIMPGDNAVNPFVVPGSNISYSCAAGSQIGVPVFHADLMIGVGWVNALGHYGASGTTAQRPSSPYKGQTYLDTTVNAVIVFAGPKTGWLRSTSGASV